MYHFSPESRRKLKTCFPQIQAVMFKAIEVIDFTIICGIRLEAAQNKAFAEGKSTKRFPYSAHNPTWHFDSSRAVDVAPWFHKEPHIRWEDIRSFIYLGGVIVGIARDRGLNWKWGGDWNRNGILNFYEPEFKLNDLAHHELLL